MYRQNFSKLVYISCLCLLATSCGFQLAGAKKLPEQLNSLSLQSNQPYSSFTSSLKQNLRLSGIKLSRDANYKLIINDKGLTYNTSDYGSSNQARIYHFTYTVEATLKKAKGAVIFGPQTFTGQTDFAYSANQLIENSSQTAEIESSMQTEIINQLSNRLASPQVAMALSKQH